MLNLRVREGCAHRCEALTKSDPDDTQQGGKQQDRDVEDRQRQQTRANQASASRTGEYGPRGEAHNASLPFLSTRSVIKTKMKEMAKSAVATAAASSKRNWLTSWKM